MYNNNLSSGIQAVDEMLEFEFSGNIVMPIWFRTVVDENGKPNLLAINILADIVYWYRPDVIRDETTGQIIRYKKKFKADLLQKSLSDYANYFNCPKTSVQRAFSILQELGVVKRIMRKQEISSGKEIDVPYIELIPSVLKQLTYPKEAFDADKATKDMLTREADMPAVPTEMAQPSTWNGGVPNRNGVFQIGTGGVPNRNRGVPNRNTTENTYGENNNNINNITSSSSSSLLNEQVEKQNKKRAVDDDERTALMDRLAVGEALKYINNTEVVNTVIDELLKREDDLVSLLTAEDFMDICLDIIGYTRKITNYNAFIRTCLNNYYRDLMRESEAKEKNITEMNSKKQSKKPKFKDFEQNKYDFASLEAKLLSSDKLTPAPGIYPDIGNNAAKIER